MSYSHSSRVSVLFSVGSNVFPYIYISGRNSNLIVGDFKHE